MSHLKQPGDTDPTVQEFAGNYKFTGNVEIDGTFQADGGVTVGAGDIGTTEIADDAVTNAKTDADHPKYLKFQYDFADLGGATGAITLTDDADAAQTIPDNAVITRVTLDAITSATSGGSATIALGYTGAATAFLAATAYNNGEFTAGACTALTAAHKTTAAVSVLATIGTTTITAGKFNVYVEYIEGD